MFQVFTQLTQQMKSWDNTTGCPGDCEQRYFLDDQRGPPLTPVTLEGSGEICTKCPCGQKCLYVHKETTDSYVKGGYKILKELARQIFLIVGSHITPVIRYVDDVSFEKLPESSENSCKIHGHSFSTVSYEVFQNFCKSFTFKGPAYYDYTTNYCNMRNLMVGAGLVELEGYR